MDEVKTFEKRYTELFREAKNRVDNSDTVKYNGDETQDSYYSVNKNPRYIKVSKEKMSELTYALKDIYGDVKGRYC